MSGTFTKEDRQRLEVFNQMYVKTSLDMEHLSDEDIAALQASCLHTSMTNCGWSEYAVARQWLLPMIEDELKRRKRRAKDSA